MIRRAPPAGPLALAAGAGCFARRHRADPSIAIVEGDPVAEMAASHVLRRNP